MPAERPTADEVRAVVAREAPELATQTIEYLSGGWDFWVFGTPHLVLRVPKEPEYAGRLEREMAFLRELAPALPLPVPVAERYFEHGPNGLPFVAYRRIAGVPLMDLKRAPAPEFGAALGRFLHALHAFPVERAVAHGLELFDGPRARERAIVKYEEVARRVFPFLSCEARAYAESVYERRLNDRDHWRFEPRLCHGDIDDHNVLADSGTGELTGVVDFSDADVHNPAGDFAWAYAGGFARLGIEDQLPDLLREGGIEVKRLEGYREFLPVSFALADALHGLFIEDEAYVEQGILAMNRLVPFGQKCP
jgi:aminoglycoside phosphotransferase (APT) family kinase protein